MLLRFINITFPYRSGASRRSDTVKSYGIFSIQMSETEKKIITIITIAVSGHFSFKLTAQLLISVPIRPRIERDTWR